MVPWMNLAGEFNGMDRFEARKAVIKSWKEIGALVKIRRWPLSCGPQAYRSYGLATLVYQWFVKMDQLA